MVLSSEAGRATLDNGTTTRNSWNLHPALARGRPGVSSVVQLPNLSLQGVIVGLKNLEDFAPAEFLRDGFVIGKHLA